MLTNEELEQVWSYLSSRKIDYQSKTIDTPTSADGANIRIPVIDLRNNARQAGNMDLGSVLGIYSNTIDSHIDDKNNPHEVTAEEVGFGNVDNTSDEDKPISTTMQGALDDLEAKIEAVVKDKIMPVGSIYVQFKDQSEPADIFGGTWQNISNQYAGEFFRTEGGNAVAFGQSQAEGLPDITGYFRRGTSSEGTVPTEANQQGGFVGAFYGEGDAGQRKGYANSGGSYDFYVNLRFADLNQTVSMAHRNTLRQLTQR